MGVQDNDPVVQKAVHRIQPFEMTRQVVEWMRETGFHSVNIDLIYGLPYQTPASFVKTLDEISVAEAGPVRRVQLRPRALDEAGAEDPQAETLPSPETKLELLKLTIERLTAEGYVYIGMDHFARADDELAVAQRQKTLQRNFQGYSTRGGADIYAFGMSSISQAEGFYWQNHKELPDYYAAHRRRPAAAAPRLHHDRRGQAPPRDHHAPHVRPGPGLRRRCRSCSGSISRSISPANSNRWTTWRPTACSSRRPDGLLVTDLGRLLDSQHRHALRRLRRHPEGKPVFADDMTGPAGMTPSRSSAPASPD